MKKKRRNFGMMMKNKMGMGPASAPRPINNPILLLNTYPALSETSVVDQDTTLLSIKGSGIISRHFQALQAQFTIVVNIAIYAPNAQLDPMAVFDESPSTSDGTPGQTRIYNKAFQFGFGKNDNAYQHAMFYINNVPPVDDVSWTIPPTVVRASRLTGMTKRPFRTVTDMSGTLWLDDRPATIRSRSFTSSPCEPRSSLRTRRKSGDASSRMLPSSSMAVAILFSSAGNATSASSSGPSNAFANAGTRALLSHSPVRRELRSKVAMASRWAGDRDAPSTRSRLSAGRISGTGWGTHGFSSSTSERTAATRECSRASQLRSAVGVASRLFSAPSADEALPATRSRALGNSITRSACSFTLVSDGKTRTRECRRQFGFLTLLSS